MFYYAEIKVLSDIGSYRVSGSSLFEIRKFGEKRLVQRWYNNGHDEVSVLEKQTH